MTKKAMGWIHEKELLEKVVPVDSVSQFIHFFSNSHTIAFFVILGFFGIWYIHRAIRRQKLQLIWLNDIDSVFPTVLSWLVATAATLYASIQHFVPGTWEQFYYNPSLNPFSLPFILSLFMYPSHCFLVPCYLYPYRIHTISSLYHKLRYHQPFSFKNRKHINQWQLL